MNNPLCHWCVPWQPIPATWCIELSATGDAPAAITLHLCDTCRASLYEEIKSSGAFEVATEARVAGRPAASADVYLMDEEAGAIHALPTVDLEPPEDESGSTTFTLDLGDLGIAFRFRLHYHDQRARNGGHYRGPVPPAPVGGAA